MFPICDIAVKIATPRGHRFFKLMGTPVIGVMLQPCDNMAVYHQEIFAGKRGNLEQRGFFVAFNK
jgi:hypothetical protein